MTRRVTARLTEVELDGEASIYHPGTDRVVLLNGSATAVWRLVDGVRDDATIATEIASRYGIDAETARAGVTVALDHLVAEQLVEPLAGPPET